VRKSAASSKQKSSPTELIHPPSNSGESVQRYMPLVRSIARRIYAKLPKHYDMEDLVSDGILGLLAAIERFDPARGVKFETFATYYVKGSILDNLPKLPTIPVAQRGEPVERYDTLEGSSEDDDLSSNGREIESDAALLYNKITQVSYSYILSLDAPAGGDADESFNLLSQIGSSDSVHREIEFEELQGILRLAIEQLPVQERTTLKYYYFHKMPFNEIGKKLGLSESWVSRIHKRALEQLRVKLGKKKSIDDFIS